VSLARQTAEVLVRALADRPEAIVVSEADHRGTTVVEITAAPGDTGKIIGRQGRTIAALRTLVAAAAGREGRKATLEVRDAPARR
jgi:predicted RNA-binding protein YlqC (UPF0109 family)